MADSSSKVLPVRTNFVGVVGDMRRDMEGHHYAGRGGRKEGKEGVEGAVCFREVLGVWPAEWGAGNTAWVRAGGVVGGGGGGVEGE